MNKKILIGCIIAVVIIVLASFTPVVGFQSMKSSSKKASPLFAIRTKRAISEERDTLTCEYLGKETGHTISFPKRDSKTVLIRKAINIIRMFDDITFNRFLEGIIHRIRQDRTLDDVETQKIVTALHQIRKNPGLLKNYPAEEKDDITTSRCSWEGKWFPGCYILLLVTAIIAGVLLFILYIIYTAGGPTTACDADCWP